jgi:hypothetical protein
MLVVYVAPTQNPLLSVWQLDTVNAGELSFLSVTEMLKKAVVDRAGEALS